MKATYAKSGDNFLPVLDHGCRREVLHGPPLATRKTAMKYAMLEKIQRDTASFRARARSEYGTRDGI
jgi:hypothetical protein